MDTIWKICCLALMTITLSGQVTAQTFIGYYDFDGNMVTMTCEVPDEVGSTQADTYDYIKVYMSEKTLDTFAPGSVTELAEKTEGDQEVTYFIDNPNDKYVFSMDYTKASVSLIIDNLVYDDDARYWCTFEDRSGTTNSATVMNAIDLTVLHKATIALTNSIDNTETNDLADGDAAPSSDVVSGHPVSFTCALTDSNPAPDIVWKIAGTEVTDGGGISITTGAVQEGSDPLLKDITSTLTFTPQLDDGSGVVAFDDNVVECDATQSWKNDELSVSCLSKQQLNVLLRPVQAGMTFTYDGNTYNNGDTIDIVRGQTIDITANVVRSRGPSDITFTPNIDPLDSPSTGTETDDPNGDDSRLSDASRTYSFRAVNGNHGDSLEFSANNDAIDYAGTGDETVEIFFNLLAGPDSRMSSTNPVDDTTDGPYTGEHTECDQKITIIAGQDLTITCRSDDVDPFAVITVYQDDVEVDQSSSNTNFGANPHVTSDGSLFDTSFDYTFVNPQFSDNGDVISCVARNTINGVTREATSSACLDFVVRPSAGGFISAVDGVNLGGATPTFPVTESETQTVSDGEEVSYTCSADNASPAATITWYYTPNGGTREDITDDAGDPDDVEDADGLIDSTSTLTRTLDFIDCGAKIECVISHPQSDVDPAITYEVTLDIPLAPPTDTLPLISSGGDDYAQANTPGAVTTVALDDGSDYTFTCTSEVADEEPDIRWNLRNNNDPTGDTEEIDTHIINDTPDCTASSNSDTVTITADFDTHHNHRLQCVTENDAGSADSYILLTVEVPPDEIVMYVDQGVIDAGTTHTANEGDDLVFNCVARNANPAAEIFWRLPSRGGGNLNEESETEDLDAGDNLYDTTSTLDLNDYNYQAGDCDAVLSCTTVHDETGNTSPLTDSVTLKVRVPPESVSISLLETGSGQAALSTAATTDLTSDEVVDEDTLIVLHGRNYNFRATTNEEDPPADFAWERRSSADGFETTLDTYTAPSNDISCNEASSSDEYPLNSVDYDVYNDRRIRVTADNEHSDGAVDNYVILDVYAEVKDEETDFMELIVRDNPVVQLDDSEYILTHGEDYTVDCLVKQATPEPTIDLDLGEDDLGATPKDPSGTDVDEVNDPGALLSQMVTTGRDGFIADYADHCGETLVCTASNAANTLLGDGDQTISYDVKVISPVSTVDLSWFAGTGGSFDDGTSTAILIDTTADNDFRCVVSGADEEANVALDLVDSRSTTSQIHSWPTTEQKPDCIQETDTEESSEFPTVDYATHHDATLTCCAANSATDPDVCDTITLEVHKPPEDLNLYVTGVDGTEREYNDGDTVYIQAGDTDFKCESLNSNPAVDIDWTFAAGAATPEPVAGNEVPGTPDGDDLIDVVNTITDRPINECYTVTCSATNDAITALRLEDAFTIEVNVVPSVGPGDPVIALTDSSDDEDGNTAERNEHAILIEGNEYEFECTVAINMADPDAHIRWELYDAADTLLHHEDDDSGEAQADCNLEEVQEQYTLADTYVTYDDLQCGYLKCIAYHGDDPTTGNEATMHFQIWKRPEPSPSGGGGDGIELRYREVGNTDAWSTHPTLTNDQDLTLDVGTAYEFQCTAFGVNPVNDLSAAGGTAAGTCGAGSPTSSVERDVLNINFYYHNDAVDDGESNDGESATYDTGNELYDLTDTFTRTIEADDNCPADLICRADFNANGNPTPSNTDTPYIVVHITRASPTTEVEIIPPTFDAATGIRGEEIDDGNLALYDGDTYELKCAARGADPDTEIIWWLVDDCTDPNNDASNGAPSGPIREAFDPTETDADCTRQNDPDDNDDDIDVWSSFRADFDEHHMKCLRCISGDDVVDQYTLDIRKAPSEIILFDGPTDDDSDGDIGEDDELDDDPQPVCNGKSFDFMAIAYAANPAVDPFEITLNGVTVADNTPDNGINVGDVDVTVSNIDDKLRDSKVVVSFPEDSLTLADNEHILKVCDPDSNVCEEFQLDIVDLPDSPVELLVTDPFATERTPPGNPTDTHELNDGDNPVRLHLGETYTFTCNAEQARPYAELKYTLNPPNGPLNYSPTTPTPDPDDAGVIADLTTLFDSSSTFLYTISNFDSSGSRFCCVAENTATEIECGDVPVDTCVTLEIIDEPSDVVLEFQRKDGASSGFEPVGNMIENGNTYTDLREDDSFDFRCTALESAPKADIKWEFEPIDQYDDFDLLDNADGPIESVDDSLDSPIEGRVDTLSVITFQASKEVQGGKLKCCADHIAIPDDEDGTEIYEDPGLEQICVETILRFPVAPSHLEIWELPEGAGQPNVFNKGDQVKANVGEEFVLNCTSYESRPKTYIGWSSSDLSASADPARVSSFIASDCPYSYRISSTATTDPLTLTYDTTKCVYLTPIEEDHLRKVYCSATNIADTTGDDTLTYVQLYLCIPCAYNLELLDVPESGGDLVQGQADSYDNDGTVVFKRNGEERTLSCINWGARDKPVIDIYIQEAGSDEPILLTSDNGITYFHETNLTLEGVIPVKANQDLWKVEKRVTLSVGGHSFDINGATLICKCTNSVFGGESTHSIEVTLKVFDQPPVSAQTYMGTGTQDTFVDIDGGRIDFGAAVLLSSLSIVTGNEPDPFEFPNFPAIADLIGDDVFDFFNRAKRQTEADTNQMTCYTLGTKPAVDFIWKLDDQVISGDFINTYSEDSQLNQGPGQGLVDTYSTVTLDPAYRGYHSRELCCEISSSIIGSPIKRCSTLIVLGRPNSPLEVSGTNVVNEGQTVQLQCTATEHFPAGSFQWDDSDGNTLLSDEAQSPTQLHELSNFRLEQYSQYSFTATREDNGKNLVCKFDQHFDKSGITFDATTTGEIEIAVNFCPSSNAQMVGCPSAPVAPGRAVTVSCETAVSNPALRIDWYLNNIAQSPLGASTTQARDYGYVTIQTFTTRQLGDADDGLQLQCCPTHPTSNIGCGQLCSSVCTVRVEQPPPDVGCRWVRLELTLEHIDGSDATWHTDYENSLSAAYRTLVNGLTDVLRQVFDGLPDYRSAIVPTIKESPDGLVQVIVGLEFDSPYASTTDHITQALHDAIDGDGRITHGGGNVSPYDVLPNSITAVCVCQTGYCVRGPECSPSIEDFSSSCNCPENYAPPRCDVHVPPGPGTQPPTTDGILYGRLAFILDEIDDIPAIWSDDYDDLTDPETQDLINGLDTVLTGIFSPAFACFRNVRIADLFQASQGGIGVVAGVDFSQDCGVTVDDLRETFLEHVDNDQRIDNSIYELDGDFLSETNVEEVCGGDFSCSNGGHCVPSDTLYYNSCECPPGYSGSRCQVLVRVVTTEDPLRTEKPDPKGLSTEALIGIIIGVVLFAAILIGLLLLCCFLCGDRERVRTRYVYTDDDEPPRRGYSTPPGQGQGYGSYPKGGRKEPYDDWPWASDGRPPVAYNRDTFDFESRRGAQMGPRAVFS